MQEAFEPTVGVQAWVITQPRRVSVSLADLGVAGSAEVRDLRTRKDLGTFTGAFAPEIKPHGAGHDRVEPQN
jgi:hypothetical protein